MLLDAPLETPQLLLRNLAPGHGAGAYARWMRDETVTRYLEVRFAPPGPEALARYIADMNGSSNNLLLGLFPKVQPDRHVGNIKLGPINASHKVAAVGILIGEQDMWGRGLAREAIDAMARHAFSALGLERLEAGFYAGNEGSMRAFEAAGFVDEGCRRAARLFEGRRIDEYLKGRLRVTVENQRKDCS